MVRGLYYGILYSSSSLHSGTTLISSSYFHKVHVWTVLHVVRAINNGVNQTTYLLLECLIPDRDFHGGVAGEIKHTNCWQTKCVLNCCSMLCICVRFYWKRHVGSIQLGVWTQQSVRDQWRANTTVTQQHTVPNTHTWNLSSILQPRPLEVDGIQWWVSGYGLIHPIFSVLLTLHHSALVYWNKSDALFI
jgi:hypothetical protein